MLLVDGGRGSREPWPVEPDVRAEGSDRIRRFPGRQRCGLLPRQQVRHPPLILVGGAEVEESAPPPARSRSHQATRRRRSFEPNFTDITSQLANACNSIIPSLGVYTLIAQSTPTTIIHHLSADKLAVHPLGYEGIDAVVPLSEFGVELALAEIYQGMEFTPEADETTVWCGASEKSWERLRPALFA